MGRDCGIALVRRVVGFLESVFVGCFVACFRIRDPDGGREATGGRSRRPLLPDNQLGSAFLVEEKEGDQREKIDNDRHRKWEEGFEDIDEEIKHEAKYLKTCGAILKTPVEIRKSESRMAAYESTERDHLPDILVEESGSKEQASDRSESSPERIKQPLCVEMSFQSPRENFPLGRTYRAKNDSPYPTPLLLTDDMQTPATVCTSQRKTPKAGGRARHRIQYVYPVLKPIENRCSLKSTQSASKKRIQDINSKDSSMAFDIPLGIGLEFPNTANLSFQSGKAETSFGATEMPELSASSLSHWLNPSNSDSSKGSGASAAVEHVQDCNGNLGASPTFVTFRGSCIEDDPASEELPKWWVGNGIPNTTTKYKEDQRVNWHATPFEERLEKALSGANVCHSPRRILGGRTIDVENNEEADRAVSA